MNNDILDIFYNEVIPEASLGRIDCFVKVNIIFDLNINNKYITKVNEDEIEYNNLSIPTLKISDKEKFDSLLTTYVEKALEFYDESNFIEEIRNNDRLKKKYIVSLLFGNASYDDFGNPLGFLNSRINMFDNSIINTYEPLEVGFIDKLNAKLVLFEDKGKIYNETPYVIKSYLEFNDGYKLYLPNVFIGQDEKNYIVYAIQKDNKNIGENDKLYQKEIRKYIPARIKGSPESYFISSLISLAICKDKEILINPFLISRWNSKRIAAYYHKSADFDELTSKQESIQSNLTEGLIRLYTKIIDYSDNINITLAPNEMDDKMHIDVNDEYKCNIELFDDIFNLVSNINKKEIQL